LKKNVANDTANKLYGLIINRFYEECPNKRLSNSEMDAIWYTIYEKLCKGESEEEVKEWCMSVPLKEESVWQSTK